MVRLLQAERRPGALGHRTAAVYPLGCGALTLALIALAPGSPALAQNNAPTITSSSTFSVNESATEVANLTASDDDGDDLTWSIADPPGDDGALFELGTDGALTFAEARDYEDPGDDDEDNVYELKVSVSDGEDSATAELQITVADVAPGLAGPTAVSHPEGKRGLRLAAYTVNDSVAWSLTGDDSAKFTIADGFLRFVDPPDHESAGDTGANNVYDVTVSAADGTSTETTGVAVTVTDVDERGVVTLSLLKPKVGTALTASLADPDTVSGTTTWLWERNLGREGWETVSGATAASYTPTAADGDRYLRATATYTDGHGAGKTAQATASHVVIAYRLSGLSFPGLTGVTRDSRASYPSFDPDTLHYAARCGSSVNVTATVESSGIRLSANGVQRSSGRTFTVTGLGRESDIRIVLAGAGGGSTTYTVHCMDRYSFPRLVTVKANGATEELMAFRAKARLGGGVRSYLILMDNNRLQRTQVRPGRRLAVFPALHQRDGFSRGLQLHEQEVQ